MSTVTDINNVTAVNYHTAEENTSINSKVRLGRFGCKQAVFVESTQVSEPMFLSVEECDKLISVINKYKGYLNGNSK